MSSLYYSTDSEEHLINIGERGEEQWDDLTAVELEEDLMDSWDLCIYEDKDKLDIYNNLLEEGE